MPLGRWLREDLREGMLATLTDPSVCLAGVLRDEAVAGLVNDHLSERDDHRHRLWALVILARWLVEQG